MEKHKKAFLFLHLSVFLFGFTAILGDIIDLNFPSIVWWRSLLTSAILVFMVKISTFLKVLSPKIIIKNVFIGFILAIHWLFFYGAIKISNPTMALIALSSSSLITALLEPLMIRKAKFRLVDIVIGILIIPGFVLIFYNSDQLQQKGLWIGIGAAILGTTFSILNKKWLIAGKELKMTFIQLTSVVVTISLFFLFFSGTFNLRYQIPVGIDWFYMLIFALFCTVLAYYLYLKAFNHISAFDVSLAFNMEPIYGIIMAALLLKDYKEVSSMVYLGMIIIISLVFLDTYIKFKKGKIEREADSIDII
jgi:drug/metabolite transporter (DMT)-like permease